MPIHPRKDMARTEAAIHSVAFFLLLVLLPTQLAYHTWPQWSLVLGRRIDYLSPTLFFTDIVLIMTIASWGISKISQKAYTLRVFTPQLVILLGSIATFIFVNIRVSPNPAEAIYGWLKVCEFVAVMWYVRSTQPAFRIIVSGLTIGVLYSSIIGLAQFFLQHSLGGTAWFIGERTFDTATPGIATLSWCLSVMGSGCREILRAYATFPHPNAFGGYLAVTLPIIAYAAVYHNSGKTERFLYYFSLVCGIGGLAVSFSRSAWVAYAASLLGLSIFLYGKRLNVQDKLIPLAFCTVLFAAALILTLHSLNASDESVTRRLALNASAVTEFVRSPLVGVGLKNFLVVLPSVDSYRGINFLQPVHNMYLLVVSETGIVGLCALVSVLSYIVWRYIRYRHTKTSAVGIFDVYMISWTALLILGLVDHYMVTLQQGQILTAVFSGLVLAQNRS